MQEYYMLLFNPLDITRELWTFFCIWCLIQNIWAFVKFFIELLTKPSILFCLNCLIRSTILHFLLPFFVLFPLWQFLFPFFPLYTFHLAVWFYVPSSDPLFTFILFKHILSQYSAFPPRFFSVEHLFFNFSATHILPWSYNQIVCFCDSYAFNILHCFIDFLDLNLQILSV